MNLPGGRRPVLIGLAGGTGSGKTTVAQAIFQRLAGRPVVVLEMDAYYLDHGGLPLEQRAAINYDHPLAFDKELLIDHLHELLAGRPVRRPVYDFRAHARLTTTVLVSPADVIILEGILVLEDERLRQVMDIKLYVDTDPDVRIIRRLQRDIRERGRSFASVVDQYLRVVRPMHLQFVEPSKRYADIVIPEGGENLVAIDVIASKIEHLLDQAAVAGASPAATSGSA